MSNSWKDWKYLFQYVYLKTAKLVAILLTAPQFEKTFE